MGNRTAKFVSALVGSIIAGAPLAAVSQNAPAPSSTANAAADCLASPKGAAPQGQHWYYRLDRTTKRQCWYLRAAGGKSSQTAQATTDAPEADSAAPQAMQNARAEYTAPQTSAAPGMPNMSAPAPAATNAPPVAQQPPSGAPATNAQQPAVTARWPEASPTSAAPAPPAPVAATAPAGAKPAKPPAPMALAGADGTADKPAGSVQMLLLVIGGALALAGILASVIYRFAGGRLRIQAADRRGHWDDWAPQDHDVSRAPWLGAEPAVTPRAQQGPVDFDEVRPPQSAQIAAFTKEIGRIAAQSASIRNKAAELDKADIFNGKFEIEASAPRLAVKDIGDEKAVDHQEDAQAGDAVDVDVITAMLERLAKQGPRLPQPSPEAELAELVRNQRGQSAARA
ncbi:hypothetical protein GA0061098_1002474 [Bradyrhizobium shewense]|uniref:Meckel syndrome type 1 protein n=1 Tax=Bradyrhizobium shewense TaxID=1761772 RepID=A0A1C3UVC9_9BRAD|nr:hypothetical protein [Bradyrhizobium shewense]SCB19399.1 hypothetical protein GA0061098_1002474 [Bradyrhizobium shewense]